MKLLRLLDFSNIGYDVFQRWYVDGRLYYHAIIDESKVRDGIKELQISLTHERFVRSKRLVKEAEKNVTTQVTKAEYYLYNDKGFNTANC